MNNIHAVQKLIEHNIHACFAMKWSPVLHMMQQKANVGDWTKDYSLSFFWRLILHSVGGRSMAKHCTLTLAQQG